MERIQLNRSFRHGKRLLKLLHPGTYRIGLDVTKELAMEMVKSGAAVKVDAPGRLLPGSKYRGRAPENQSIDTRNFETKVV